jgi:Arc/MetJ-type ribon-helix-helix transcriptional regulator
MKNKQKELEKITDLKEQVLRRIKKRIENPRFKSKIEVARYSLQEYEREFGRDYKRKLERFEERIKKLEILSTRKKDKKDFNDGYSQALLDYKIFTKNQINRQMQKQRKNE